MKLYEYMGKDIFRREGIAVPRGQIFFSVLGVEDYARELGSVVVKSQVLFGGRGKGGGIKFADNPGLCVESARELLGSKLGGMAVEAILVEEKLNIEKEYYLAITIDSDRRKPVVIASAHGGVNIEEVSEELLVKMHVDVHIGIQPYFGREVARRMGLPMAEMKQFASFLCKVYELFRKYDAELVEINPLVVTNGKLVAADAKVTLDHEALYRIPQWVPRVEIRSERELLAAEIGISFVELEGDIGVMSNGAGITMATLDIINHFGGSPRNFMDAGGGASMEVTAMALEILLSSNPKALLVNIFGGITRCDDVARAFAQVKEKMGIQVPVVIRLAGTNEQAGVEILKQQGITAFKDIQEAVVNLLEQKSQEVS